MMGLLLMILFVAIAMIALIVLTDVVLGLHEAYGQMMEVDREEVADSLTRYPGDDE